MPDSEKLGKYEICRQLGRGAMGVVYEGYDPFIQRTVALKTIRKELLDQDKAQEMLARFQREAQAAGRLNHPNIVAIYEYGEDQDTAYIAMEFVDGKELKELFAQNTRFELADTVNIMAQLLSALQYSHQHGVVHRDIKPANIIVMADGQVKIADFGIARLESSSLTQTGSVLGTPHYISPEQFMGQHVDGRSDLFSAGVVLYQLLTGEKPFVGESTTTIMYQVLNNTPNAPSQLNVQVPAAFDGVIRKALAKRPDERFQSGQEFLDAIKLAAGGKPFISDVETTIVIPKPNAARPPDKKKLWIGAGVAVAVVIVAGIASLTPSRQPSPPVNQIQTEARPAPDVGATTKLADKPETAAPSGPIVEVQKAPKKTAPKKIKAEKPQRPTPDAGKSDPVHAPTAAPANQPRNSQAKPQNDKPNEKKKGIFGEELKPSPWRKEGELF